MQLESTEIARTGSGTAFGRPRNFLGNRFVYAVISQRAHGLSIGVNLNPQKYCNFNCVYCEVKRGEAGSERPVNVRVLSAELKRLLELAWADRLRELEWFGNVPPELLRLKEVALSGDGEPTLCPNFEEVVEAVLGVRSQGTRFFKIVVITNTAGLPRPHVRRGLQQLDPQDEIWVKLEAGTQTYMNKVNQPDMTLRKVLANILQIGLDRPVVIQSLFPLLDGEEPSQREIEEYAHRLQELKAGGAQISMVQIYSAHRPAQNPHCGHLPLKSLSRIARCVWERTGLRAEVF